MIMSIYHRDFDPEGDTILTLNPCNVDWKNLASIENDENNKNNDRDHEPHDDVERSLVRYYRPGISQLE
jgi:hypothetical protein